MNDEFFNEKEYLDANPDVAVAIKEGQFVNGRDHYEKYGRKRRT
jgi:hypothetical protein